MPKVCIETYGCTLNRADSDIMRALLRPGFEIVEGLPCDVLILNTCTVKGTTENKLMERIRRLSAEGQGLVVAGCLTVNRERIRKVAPGAVLLGASSVADIRDAVEAALKGHAADFFDASSKEGLPKLFTPPIARIPINEGCVSSCHFCQTRLARPYLRSYSPKTIVNWINEAASQGAMEIQLTSMDLGAYGLDIKTDLSRLLGLIADNDRSRKARGGYLIRLGMINPDHARRMLPDIIAAMKEPMFYRFLHIPVQSGSEKVCREMNRAHSVQDFRDIVEAVRSEIPEATIATDIIVGYPTETEDDFGQTKRLLEEVRPEVVNVSKFSARPMTKAKELPQLHNDVIKARSTELAEIVRDITLERRKAHVGKAYHVLITEEQKDFTGRNINYLQVVVKGFKGRLGDEVDLKITDANHGCLFGEPVV